MKSTIHYKPPYFIRQNHQKLQLRDVFSNCPGITTTSCSSKLPLVKVPVLSVPKRETCAKLSKALASWQRM